MHASTVARFDQQLDISFHEWHRHSNGASVRQDELRIIPELLYYTKDIVPASAVEARAVLPQLIYDLTNRSAVSRKSNLNDEDTHFVHLENSQDGLNQNGAPDGAPRHSNGILR